MARFAAWPFGLAHELITGVAVKADHSAPLVDIRGQLMISDTVRRLIIVAGAEGGSIIPVIVVFKTAVIVGPHDITIMAALALIIAGAGEEGVRS